MTFIIVERATGRPVCEVSSRTKADRVDRSVYRVLTAAAWRKHYAFAWKYEAVVDDPPSEAE